MGYVDGFYYNSGTIKVLATGMDSEPVTARVSGGSYSKDILITDEQAKFDMLPPKEKYNCKLFKMVEEEEETIYQKDVIVNAGQYQEIELGLNPQSWTGIKNIVKANKGSEFLSIGDEITQIIDGKEEIFQILHINYRPSLYGNNVIIGKKYMLDSLKQMNATSINTGGFNATLISDFLEDYYQGLPEDMRNAITQMTVQASIGNESANLQNETHNIWLPLEYNIFGASTFAAGTEASTGGAQQFDYFVNPANRVKSPEGTAAQHWWLMSPRVSHSTIFCGVYSSGAPSNADAADRWGVVPCFMIGEN